MRLLVQLLLLLLPYFIACQRIGSTVKPIHYDLVILPMIQEENPRLCGHVIIDFEMRTTTNLVTLHSYQLDVLDVKLFPSNATRSTTRKSQQRLEKVKDMCFSGLLDVSSEWVDVIQEELDKQQINIIFKRPLFKNTRYRIAIIYRGKINNDEAKGFFKVSYKNDPETCCPDGVFSGTQMEVAHARKVLPCFDEPNFKTTFDVTIGHKSSLTALSNMPETASSPMQNKPDWKWTSFSRSPPMSTYLLAMFLTDYQFVERIYKSCNRSVNIRFWGKPNQLPHLKRLIPIVPKMMNYIETYLKQPYSLPKLDFIAPPMNLAFAGMENWGLVVLTEKYLFHIENTDSQADLFDDFQTMGHEIAHQFFGNLVTSDWWSDVWFNEGLSSAFHYELAKEAAPELLNEAELKWMSTAQIVMNIEEFKQRDPIIRQVETVKETEDVFDALTYVKANALLYMLRNFVGHENFREALITYMERYKFENSNSQKFLEIVNEKVHQFREVGQQMNVITIMDSWTKQPSFPIIFCSRLGNGRIKLSQMAHAIIDPSNNATDKNYTWWIPIAMTDARRPNFSPEGTFPRVWLTPQRPSLEISYFPPGYSNESNDWIIINGQFSSYARVMYDDANWRLIAKQLITDHTVIAQMTRFRLIDDAFTLAYFDLMSYRTVLELVEYLTITNDNFVKDLTSLHLKVMKNRAKKNEAIYTFFEDYIERMAKTYPENLSILTRSGLNHLNATKCKNWSDGLCVNEALRIFNALMDDTITPDEQRDMTKDFERYWCVAIRSGGKNEWKRAWQASSDVSWASQQTKILSAMTCSQDRMQLKQLLSRVFYSTTDQDPKDTFLMLEKMAANPTGRSMVLNFIKINWEFLGRHFRKSDDTLKLLTLVSKHFSTPEELDEVSRLLASKEAKGKGLDKFTTSSVLDVIRRNIRWMESRSGEFYEIIESKKNK